MRTALIALVSALLSAAIATGITYHHMESRVFSTTVDSFNDGFKDGACRNGEDGFGHICQ
jgi:hypothetical protein